MIDDKIILGKIILASIKPAQTARMAIEAALENAGLTEQDELQYIVNTG